MNKLRKALIISVSVMTVFSMSMIAVPFQVEAASAGSLIKIDGYAPVYYLGDDDKRYVFPNESTYFSWYSDFSTVETLGQEEVEGYPLAANVVMRPGTKLVKRPVPTDPKVYAVEPGGILRHIPTEAIAVSLYGDDWAQRVVDVADSFFVNYTIDSNEVEADVYPAGSLVKYEGGADVFYINEAGEAQKIADEAAFNANGFSWDDVLNASATVAMPSAGDDVDGATEAADTAQGGNSTGTVVDPNAGTGLSIALASDTPESGNVPLNSPADMLKFNLTASNDGDVVVNTLTVSLFDLGNWDDVEDVTLYVDGVKISSSKNITSDREAIINIAGGITVPAGTTVSVVARATLVTGAEGTYSLGLEVASDLSTDGATVSGSFPIVGNVKSATTVDIGAVVITGFSSDTQTEELGKDDVLLADFNLDVTTEDVIWETARIENKDDDGVVSNVKLYIEGDEVADATVSGDFFIFDLGNFVIEEDENIDVEVRGDIGVTDTGDTFNLQIDEATDFSFVGQSFGYPIEMTGAGLTATGTVVDLEAGEVTLDIDKEAQADEVRSDTTGVVLATFSLTSNGEDAILEEIEVGTLTTGFVIKTVTGTTTEADLANIELRDLAGGVYDLDVDYDTDGANDFWILTLDEEILLPMGVTKTFELEVDLESTIGNGVELKVTLNDDALLITGDVSDATIDNITPTSVDSDKVTVEDASLGWATEEMTNETVVEGASDVLIYLASLEAGDSSDVELKSFTLTENEADTNAFSNDNIAQMIVMLNGEELETSSDDILLGGLAGANVTFNSLDSAFRTIPAGETYTLEVYANIENSITAESFELAMDETDTDVDADDVDGDALDVTNVIANEDSSSRIVELVEAGDLMVELLTNNSDANDDIYHLAGTETPAERYLGELVFTSENEDVEITVLNLKSDGAAEKDDILYVNIIDESGAILFSEAPEIDGDVEFEFASGEFVILANKEVSYFIGIEAKPIDSDVTLGTADFNTDVKFYIEDVEASGVESTDEITMAQDDGGTVVMGEFAAATSTTMTATIVGAVITAIVEQSFTAEGLGGYQTLAEFTVVLDNGENMKDNSVLEAALLSLDLTLSSSTDVVVSGVKAYISTDTTNMTDAVDPVAGVAAIDFTTLDGEANLVDGVVTIIVKGTVTDNSNSDSSWLQAKIDSIAADLDWNADNVADGTGTDFTGARLSEDEIIFQKVQE